MAKGCGSWGQEDSRWFVFCIPIELNWTSSGLSSSSQRTLNEIQHPEADVLMHDDESNWEDIQDPNVPIVRGPPISNHLWVQLWSISAQLWSEHATLVVAMQLRTPCATLITSKNPPPQHQPRYTHLAYLLYSPFPRLSGIHSCHP